MQQIQISNNINKMSALSQISAAEITNYLMNKLDNNISSLEKVKQYKPAHSAQQIFGILGQLTDQISSATYVQGRLKTPHQNKNLRLDSHMSVFNIEHPPQKTRYRSYTKRLRRRKTTMLENDEAISQLRAKRRITTFNKIQSIEQRIESQKIQVEETQTQERRQLQKRLQIQLEKRKIQAILQSARAKPKILSSRQLKQKISFDYQCGRLKVKSQAQNHLVSSHKSLQAETSKHVIKTKVALQKPKITNLKTTKVLQKVANKTRRVKTQAEVVEVQEQPIEITFSKLHTLVDKFDCEPGVSINFNGSVLKNRRSKYQMASISTPRQYSKLDYQIMKKRSSTSFNEMTITDDQKSSPNLINYSQSKSVIKLLNQEKSSARISVQNDELREYLLEPELEQTQEQVSQTKQIKQAPLMDKTDYFNLNYIRGIKSPLTTATSRQNQRIVMPLISSSRTPQIKIREKLENRKAFITEMRKKFEQTLRPNDQRN